MEDPAASVPAGSSQSSSAPEELAYKVQYTPEKGKHLLAARPLEAGAIIMSAKGYAWGMTHRAWFVALLVYCLFLYKVLRNNSILDRHFRVSEHLHLSSCVARSLPLSLSSLNFQSPFVTLFNSSHPAPLSHVQAKVV